MPGENKLEGPAGEIITALQNRINDLEAKLVSAEKERTSKTWADTGFVDSKIAEIREEIAELRKERKAVELQEKELKKKEKDHDADNTAGKDWNPLESISL